MSGKLDDLGWPEAKLSKLNFDGNALKFSMTDILSYSDPMKFEVVNISISEIQALQIVMRPFNGSKYLDKEIVISIGQLTENEETFEGVIKENTLTNTEAEYFWLSGGVDAKNIEISRTGKYEYIRRLKQP